MSSQVHLMFVHLIIPVVSIYMVNVAALLMVFISEMVHISVYNICIVNMKLEPIGN